MVENMKKSGQPRSENMTKSVLSPSKSSPAKPGPSNPALSNPGLSKQGLSKSENTTFSNIIYVPPRDIDPTNTYNSPNFDILDEKSIKIEKHDLETKFTSLSVGQKNLVLSRPNSTDIARGRPDAGVWKFKQSKIDFGNQHNSKPENMSSANSSSSLAKSSSLNRNIALKSKIVSSITVHPERPYFAVIVKSDKNRQNRGNRPQNSTYSIFLFKSGQDKPVAELDETKIKKGLPGWKRRNVVLKTVGFLENNDDEESLRMIIGGNLGGEINAQMLVKWTQCIHEKKPGYVGFKMDTIAEGTDEFYLKEYSFKCFISENEGFSEHDSITRIYTTNNV